MRGLLALAEKAQAPFPWGITSNDCVVGVENLREIELAAACLSFLLCQLSRKPSQGTDSAQEKLSVWPTYRQR